MTYRRANQQLHVRGYVEEGTTTTPFDMCVRNRIDRFHLAIDVLDRVPRLQGLYSHARQHFEVKFIDHDRYIREHGEDMPEIRDWVWKPWRSAIKEAMNVLVLNAGSSSLKFDLIETGSERRLLKGEVERVTDMNAALEEAFQRIGSSPVDAVGNRVVHGGDRFREPVLINDAVEKEIEQLSVLAPLHNPHNLAALRAARRRLPQAKHVAVFDTAFHATIPPHAYVYGLPWEYLEKHKIRRYGFHGISHRYI